MLDVRIVRPRAIVEGAHLIDKAAEILLIARKGEHRHEPFDAEAFRAGEPLIGGKRLFEGIAAL